ncbi:MAG: DUF1778 domain-containing protein [Proteobacteria bacterium]|nr:DUF1778 domain-containing protein [Pseudomonadota bacterium]
MEGITKDDTKVSRTARLGFRVTSHQESLIRKAAEISGKNVTQFVLNSACEAAENTLIDQRIFFTDDKKYRAFQKALERSARIKPKLQKLMRTDAPWEK